MPPLKRLLVVENEPKDMKLAADIARSIGVPEVDGRTTFDAAKVYLDRGLNGEGPLPDGIVLDLDLGHDSGYELLRYWHSTPKLSDIPLIVWSILGEEQRTMCNLFKVKMFVGKWEGVDAFRDALGQMNSTGNS